MVLRWEGDDLPMFKYDHCVCFLLLFNKLPQPQWINHRSQLLVSSIPALSSIGRWVQSTTAGSSPLSLGSVKSRVGWPGLEFGGSEEKLTPSSPHCPQVYFIGTVRLELLFIYWLRARAALSSWRMHTFLETWIFIFQVSKSRQKSFLYLQSLTSYVVTNQMVLTKNHGVLK